MTTPEEKQLLSLLKQHDKSAIKAIFENYHDHLCQVSLRIVNDEGDAKDVVQDVFIKLWKNREDLDVRTSLGAYLKRAVVNTSLNYIKKQKRFKTLEPKESDQPKYGSNEVEQNYVAGELSLLIEKSIQNLPVRTRAVFTLIRSDEMSYKEVAKALDVSLKVVEKEMMKALRLLRIALKDYLNILFFTTLSKVIEIFLKNF